MKKQLTTSTSYLLMPGHDQLFQATKSLQSELEFYKIEMEFLRKLLDKTFLRVTTSSEAKEIEKMESELKKISEKELPRLIKSVVAHMENLGELEEEVFSKSETKFRTAHNDIKVKVYAFSSEFRTLKSAIYKYVEKLIRRGKKTVSAYVEGNLAL